MKISSCSRNVTGSRQSVIFVTGLIVLSIAGGVLYPALDGRFGLAADILLKGSGVSMLAIAALFLQSPRAAWLAVIMAAGAIGDMLLEVPGGFIAGASAFAVGHCCAIALYLRFRRPMARLADKMRAAALIGWGLAMPFLLMPAGAPIAGLIFYSLLLCTMAAAALLSRFPRHLAGLGALLFVVSDTFLIMRLGGRLVGNETVHDLVVWYSYYAGQLLIFIGVATGLAAANRATVAAP